jgi:cytochrome c oxidase subunit 2
LSAGRCFSFSSSGAFDKRRNPVASHEGVTSGISTHLEFAVVLIEAVLLVGLPSPFGRKGSMLFPDERTRLSLTSLGNSLTGNFTFPGRTAFLAGVISRSRATPTRSGSIPPTRRRRMISWSGRTARPGRSQRRARYFIEGRDPQFLPPGMRIAQGCDSGQIIPMWFRPIKTGTYEVVCGQLCGLGHYAMKGSVWSIHRGLPSLDQGAGRTSRADQSAPPPSLVRRRTPVGPTPGTVRHWRSENS